MNDCDDITDRVRKQVRLDNPRLPLKGNDGMEFWYMSEHVWPYLRELQTPKDVIK